MSAQRSSQFWQMVLAALTIVVFFSASVSIVVMLGLLPAEEIEQFRTLVE